MKIDQVFSNLIHRFFFERLVQQKEASPNTIKTYRDAVKFFLQFLFEKEKKEITLKMFCAENVVDFLNDYEKQKKRSSRSRNSRLATLKALAKFATYLYPECSNEFMRINYIAMKRETQKVISYLEYDEMEYLLKQPNRNSPRGRIHYSILLFLYNTGVRVSELINLDIEHLHLTTTKSVHIRGKGGKEHFIPLWKETIIELEWLTSGRLGKAPVFLNQQKERYSRKGISHIVAIYVEKASDKKKSIKLKNISPHSIRHTTAMHLLQSGVDMNAIRLWLGHTSIETTNVYIETDLEMKRKTISSAHFAIPALAKKKWNAEEDVISFLESL